MSDGNLNDPNHEAFKNFPGGVTLSWGIVKKPSRGPKGELSIPQIVQAAVEIADREGLTALSMGKIAKSLGFTTMSLYRYVSSKNDLLLLMQDAVCDIPVPDENAERDWREEMREYVRACVGIFRDHPWYSDITIRNVPLTPNTLRLIDWTLRMMRDFPLNDYEKMSFVLLLNSYARACGLIERDKDVVIKGGDSLDAFSGSIYTAGLKALVKEEDYPHLYPVVMAGAYTEEADNPIGDDLAFGLERILDGIEQYIEMKKTPE
ncbi:TetR/AcrR family transcriptional regulator [Paenibacillus sp. 1011MAR3C5]|uniref:TetR/AcrR family transcriptional regulator n=1 Tax=Paenibacillus sp. 1011MAR3C5 TaxID=1675787 RepID=UPI000E6C3B6E|nr:TetR/AcrR family transcriptional regulator [Paenibacillus sp. 1011MAR3C5]RJE85168.1 TetR/AcrR family transcriptional regulator [Paenibacillus sp. 1011MAR3C5]